MSIRARACACLCQLCANFSYVGVKHMCVCIFTCISWFAYLYACMLKCAGVDVWCECECRSHVSADVSGWGGESMGDRDT